MFKKIFALFLIALLVFPGVHAGYSYYPENSVVASGDYYQVLFDERGQATVIEYLQFTNYGEQAVEHIVFEIPANSVKIRYALQEVANTFCPKGAACITSYTPNYVMVPVEELSDGVYRVKLNQSIAKGNTGKITIYYKAMGYATVGLLSTDFDFQTNKWPFDVDYTRVAVSVTDELALKGGESRSDYKINYASAMVAMESAPAKASAGLLSSSDIGATVQSVKYAYGFIKEKRGLNPYEIFHVTGLYSDNWLKLYLFEFGIGLLVLAGLGFVIKHLFGKYTKTKKDNPQMQEKDGKLDVRKFDLRTASDRRSLESKTGGVDYGRSVISGILAALIFSVIGFLLIMVRMATSTWFFTDMIILVVVLGCIYPFGVFLYKRPAFGNKEAAITGLFTFVFSVLFFPFVMLLVLLFQNIFLWNPTHYEPLVQMQIQK